MPFVNHPGCVIVDEDFLGESCADGPYHCGHHRPPIILPNHHHPLSHVDSIRSEASVEDNPYRNAHRDSGQQGPPRDHYKILDVDPDGIQVMGEIDLQHLPEAVNREILKNSREIIYEEPETSEESSPLLRLGSKRCSKRSLYHRNILKGLEEDRRSLDGSRRSLNGSRRYLLVPLDRPLEPRESLAVARRHTGSKERLNAIRRNISAKENELRGRPGLNDDRLTIEMEKFPKQAPRLQQITEGNRTSLSDPNLSPTEYSSSKLRQSPSPIPVTAISPTSDLSPESGFYDGTHCQWNSSPEYVRKDLRLSHEATITRNRRSYENAQLQDVNEALSRPNSDHSSLDSEETPKNSAPQNREKSVIAKQPVSYTSV